MKPHAPHSRKGPCPQCDGTGNDPEKNDKCTECGGIGWIEIFPESTGAK